MYRFAADYFKTCLPSYFGSTRRRLRGGAGNPQVFFDISIGGQHAGNLGNFICTSHYTERHAFYSYVLALICAAFSVEPFDSFESLYWNIHAPKSVTDGPAGVECNALSSVAASLLGCDPACARSVAGIPRGQEGMRTLRIRTRSHTRTLARSHTPFSGLMRGPHVR